MRRRQGGMSAIGILIVLILVVFAALIGMRVTPAYLEYFAIKKAVASMAASGELRGGTVADVRKSFERHQAIDDFTSVGPQDLEISKDGGDLTISFAYEKRVPLFYNISLMINFAGSSQPGRTSGRGE
jgi:Domain of unknown function (DUF4845)